MSRIIIGIGTKFFYNKCGYEIIRSNGESKFVCKNLQFEVEEELTIDQMLEYANQNQLIFKNLGVKVNEIELKDDFAGYEEDEINEANYRYHCIEPLLKNKPEVTMKERIAQLREEGIEVSKTRMYEWLSSYVNGGYDRRFLVSKRNQKGGKEKPRTVERVNILLGEIIEKHYKIVHPKRPPALYKLLKARIHHENIARESNGQELLKCPSKRTIFRRISRLDRYETAKAQYGPLYVYTTQGFVQAMERPTRPLQFVQFDSTSIDLIFVHDDNRVVLKRATFTAAIDVFSRVIIGFNIGFKKPGYESTMLALRNAIMQKNIKEKYPFLKNEWPTYGLPENIILDNGPEFKNRNLALACEQLGINIVFCKVKQPWTKGIIERFLQTFNYQLNHILPGTTFANPKTKKNKEYDSEAKACIGFKKYLELFHLWMIDIYHVSIHEGLENTPLNVWTEGRKLMPTHVYHDPYTCSIILLPSETRTIQDDGIRWENLKYQSEALWKLRNERMTKGLKNEIRIKYDPDDISKIYVEDLNGKFFEVYCTNQKYSKNLNLEMHHAVRGELAMIRESVDDLGIAMAFESLVEKAEEEAEKHKKYSSKNSKMTTTGSNATSETSPMDVAKTKSKQYQNKRLDQHESILKEDEEFVWGDSYYANKS